MLAVSRGDIILTNSIKDNDIVGQKNSIYTRSISRNRIWSHMQEILEYALQTTLKIRISLAKKSKMYWKIKIKKIENNFLMPIANY